jgi:SRSO17 transposase
MHFIVLKTDGRKFQCAQCDDAEPMAARTAPARTAAQHQSLLHFVGVAPWLDEKVLAKVRELTKRTEGSLRQKALKLGISLGHRR